MKYLVSLAIMCNVLLYAAVIPQPRNIDLGQTITAPIKQIRLTVPDSKAGTLLKELLPPFPANVDKQRLELVFSCGTGDSEEYTISSTPKKIAISGKGPRGMFHGAATLLQLMRQEADTVSITLAQLQDAPAWAPRWSNSYAPFTEQNLVRAFRYKFGGLTYQWRKEWHKFTRELCAKTLTTQLRYAEAGALDFMFAYHIYASAGKREREIFNIANLAECAELAERCRIAYDAGFHTIMICADDWTPQRDGRYVLTHPEEIEKFHDSAAAGHAWLLNYLKQQLPQVRWIFCPPVYSISHTLNAPAMQEYLHVLGSQLAADIAIAWTGPQVISTIITEQDHKRFSDLVQGHALLLWENSECHPIPVHCWKTTVDAVTMTEPVFHNDRPFFGPLQQIYGIMANAFSWNPHNFHPESCYAAIMQRLFPHYDPNELFELQRLYDILNDGTQPEQKAAHLAAIKKLDADLVAKGLVNVTTRNYLQALYDKVEFERPQMEVKLVSQAPALNGKLDDPCWQTAKEYLFRARNGKDVPAPKSTRVKLVFDREALYIAMTAQFDMPQRSVPYNHYKDLFNSSDLLECFIMPGQQFMQIAVDHEGHKFTWKGRLKTTEYDTKILNGWNMALNKTEHEWTVEIKIPFETLQIYNPQPPQNGTKWKANFCREASYDGSDLQCWSPTGANSFLKEDMFGTLIFVE